MSVLEIILVALVGYLLGSISFASLIGRAHGVNILEAGSGNPGATNVKRVIGRWSGNLCFALDCVKGALSAWWPLLPELGAHEPELLGLIGLGAALVGHSFSAFLRFRGGKGVAVTIGGLLVLMPWVVFLGVLLWNVVFFATRYVSAASLAFGLSLPLAAWVLREPESYVAFAGVLAVLIVVRHRANIVRLLRGEENRFGKRG